MSGASVTVSLAAANSPSQPPFPTPSPYSISVASTRWRSRPWIQTAGLFLRGLSFVFSFCSALLLVALPSTDSNLKHPELLYCFSANVFMAFYAMCQIFKNSCDIAHRGIFISETASDYTSFVLDQLAGYLLVSASSVAVPVIQKMDNGDGIWIASVASVCMSFASFLVHAGVALLSGYKLYKYSRILAPVDWLRRHEEEPLGQEHNMFRFVNCSSG